MEQILKIDGTEKKFEINEKKIEDKIRELESKNKSKIYYTLKCFKEENMDFNCCNSNCGPYAKSMLTKICIPVLLDYHLIEEI